MGNDKRLKFQRHVFVVNSIAFSYSLIESHPSSFRLVICRCLEEDLIGVPAASGLFRCQSINTDTKSKRVLQGHGNLQYKQLLDCRP